MPEHRVAGFTSTGSKRPEVLFGSASGDGRASPPERMLRSAGCRVWDVRGREYLDYIMGLGAVALGYGHPAVNRAAIEAIGNGVVGPLAPMLEEEVAEEICRLMPWVERVRFLKTGAEAMAAAVRLARVVTRRELILGCGYHGWLDWCQGAAGVPPSARQLYGEIPFNDPGRARERIRAHAGNLAAVAFEPVVVVEPTREWLDVLRTETERAGALLILDDIKTVCRLGVGGGAERYAIRPDLVVMGKALANGFPLAVVGGRANVMAAALRTWISSTLATEFVALAAARATLRVMVEANVPAHLTRVGTRLIEGLRQLAARHPALVTGVGGIAEMCFLHYVTDDLSQATARCCAERGLLFKRSAYNFVSLAHDDAAIDQTLAVLEEVMGQLRPSAP